MAEGVPVGIGADLEDRIILLVSCLAVVNLQRHTFWQCPRSSVECEVSTLSEVGSIVASAVVHRVVVSQTQLIACQHSVAVAAESRQIECTIPHTALQHSTLIVRRLSRIDGLAIAERQRAIAVIGHAVHLAHLLVCIEHELLLFIVEHHCHTLESLAGQRCLALQDIRSVAILHDCHQALVLREPQLQVLAFAAVRENWHVLRHLVRFDHHLDGHVLVAEVATYLRLCEAVTTKLQRRCFLHGSLVGLTHHFEVGGGLQVVILDVLREVEDDVVANFHHTSLWFWCAEQLRTARVLHTAEHFRLVGEEGIAIPAEQHGSEVVALLHHDAITEETSLDVAVLRNHLLRARSCLVDG